MARVGKSNSPMQPFKLLNSFSFIMFFFGEYKIPTDKEKFILFRNALIELITNKKTDPPVFLFIRTVENKNIF